MVVGAEPVGYNTTVELLRGEAGRGTVLLPEMREAAAYDEYHNMCADGISQIGAASLGLELKGLIRNVIAGAEEH